MRVCLRVRCHMYLSRPFIFHSGSDYLNKYCSDRRKLRCLSDSTGWVEGCAASLDSSIGSCLEAQPQPCKMTFFVKSRKDLLHYEVPEQVVNDGRYSVADLFVKKRQ